MTLLADIDWMPIVNAILTFLALVIPSALTAWVTIQVAKIKAKQDVLEVKTDEQTVKIDKAADDRVEATNLLTETHRMVEEKSAAPKEVVVVNPAPIPVVESEVLATKKK